MENVTEISYLVDNICLGLAGAAAIGSLLVAYYCKPAQKEGKELLSGGQLEDTLKEYSEKR